MNPMGYAFARVICFGLVILAAYPPDIVDAESTATAGCRCLARRQPAATVHRRALPGRTARGCVAGAPGPQIGRADDQARARLGQGGIGPYSSVLKVGDAYLMWYHAMDTNPVGRQRGGPAAFAWPARMMVFTGKSRTWVWSPTGVTNATTSSSVTAPPGSRSARTAAWCSRIQTRPRNSASAWWPDSGSKLRRARRFTSSLRPMASTGSSPISP